MSTRSTGAAYAIWMLCLFGICGGQRFYARKYASGIVYLITFGWFGIGQLIDLALIPEMLDEANQYALPNVSSSQNVNKNLGRLSNLIADFPSQLSGDIQSNIQKLIAAAVDNGHTLSLAQAIQVTGLSIEGAKRLLLDAERSDLCRSYNDKETGQIRYKFDI